MQGYQKDIFLISYTINSRGVHVKEKTVAETIKVTKWGNCLAIRIPKHIAEEFHIYAGKRLRVTYRDECIILKVKPTHQELIDQWLQYVEVNGLHPDD